MKADHIFETVLYASDLAAAERFYSQVLGLESLRSNELMLAFRCLHGVLLIFDPAKSRVPGRDLPSHGPVGPGHLAFSVPGKDLAAWEGHLRSCGVEIEHRQDWPEGGTSLYFRDPAGNSLELASPDLWGGGWEGPA